MSSMSHYKYLEKMKKAVTYYTEYDKKVLFEEIEGLINPFINYVKGRKKLDDDYFESEYNPSAKEIYRQIDLIMIDIPDGRKSIRLLIEYGNGNSDTPIFNGSEKQVRTWISTLKAEDVYDKVVQYFEKWAEGL